MEYQDLIGKPYREGGRGPEDFDCWGLFRFVYHRWHGIWLQDYETTADGAINTHKMHAIISREWERVEEPEGGDGILLRINDPKQGNHVALCVGGDRFLHMLERTNGCTEERFSTLRWERLIRGFYRRKLNV